MKKIHLLIILFSLISSAGSAQSETIEMADGLYQSGKIYIVVISVLIILLGLLLYLIGLDRKISRVEKKLEENND